jgi:hypothetical protein
MCQRHSVHGYPEQVRNLNRNGERNGLGDHKLLELGSFRLQCRSRRNTRPHNTHAYPDTIQCPHVLATPVIVTKYLPLMAFPNSDMAQPRRGSRSSIVIEEQCEYRSRKLVGRLISSISRSVCLQSSLQCSNSF